MLDMIKNEVTKHVMTVRIQSREEVDAAEQAMQQSHVENVHYQHAIRTRRRKNCWHLRLAATWITSTT
jgi:hypothetical protein